MKRQQSQNHGGNCINIVLSVLDGLTVCVGVKTALDTGVSKGLVTAGVTGGVSGVLILTAHCIASGGGLLFDGV